MPEMFDNFSEISPTDLSNKETVEPVISPKTEHLLKKMVKKQVKKRLKREREKACKWLEDSQKSNFSECRSAPEGTSAPKMGKKNKREQTFLSKLGDAILKAVPSVMIAVATALVNRFIKGCGQRSYRLGGVAV